MEHAMNYYTAIGLLQEAHGQRRIDGRTLEQIVRTAERAADLIEDKMDEYKSCPIEAIAMHDDPAVLIAWHVLNN